MSSELPYDATRDPRWEAAVDDMAWLQRSDETVSKQGPCPRCGHEVTFVDEARSEAGERAANELGIFEECNCGVVHPGTPEGRVGCGANGRIQRSQGTSDDSPDPA